MLKKGTRVILAADLEEGLKEERGVLLSDGPVRGLYTVELDNEYRDDCSDDGIREVPEDQITSEPSDE